MFEIAGTVFLTGIAAVLGLFVGVFMVAASADFYNSVRNR